MAKQNIDLSQLSDALKEVSNTVLRNDERLKIVIKEQENIKESFNIIEKRSHNLELKLESMSMRLGNHDAKWSTIIDLIWRCALMIIAGYILYALGLQADLAFPPP
jgi:hypothetical protein